jgi:hypothetical protein
MKIVPLHEQFHDEGGHIHTHKINIKHLNSTLINTKLHSSKYGNNHLHDN